MKAFIASFAAVKAFIASFAAVGGAMSIVLVALQEQSRDEWRPVAGSDLGDEPAPDTSLYNIFINPARPPACAGSAMHPRNDMQALTIKCIAKT